MIAAVLAQAGGTPNLWNQFLTATVAGLVTAALYAIAASGLVVTYTTSGVFNFAHGAFGMMAAFTYWQFTEDWGLHPLLGLALVVFVVAPLFGAVVERVLMRNLEGTSELIKLVVTVSLLLALIGLAPVIWDSSVARSVPEFFERSDPITVAGVGVSVHRIVIFATALAVALGLRVLLYSTRIGVAMRAVVDDRSLAQLNGARPGLTSMASWGLGAGLAALAGILGAPISTLEAITLTLLVFNAYAAPVIGRLKSVPLTFVGAIILGLAQSYVSSFVKAGDTNGLERALTNFERDSGWTLANLQSAMPAIVLFVVMLFIRPDKQRSHSLSSVRDRFRVPTWRVAFIGAVLFPVATAMATVLVPEPFRISLAGGYGLALVALSLVPLAGYSGQISLAQMSFAGIGAAVMGNLGTNMNPALALVAAVVVAAAVGALVSLPALRLSGIYLALLTAAFALMLTKLVLTQQKVMPQGNIQVPPLVGGWNTSSARMIVASVAFTLVGLLVVAVRRSAFGRRLVAMKDSPDACATLGLNLTRTNVYVFALSSGIAGLGGALLASTVQADQFSFENSLAVTMLAVVGGIGLVGGAFFGGLLLGAFQSILGPLFSGNSIGYFGAPSGAAIFTLGVEQVTKFAPGLMGISLGRNPSGAMSEVGAGFRAVGERLEALTISVAGVVALWALAAADVVSGWQFTSATLVWVVAVAPLTPLLFAGPHPERRLGVAAVGVGATLVALAIDVAQLTDSNGWRVVAMVVFAALVGVVLTRLYGPLEEVDAPAPAPSPDLIGVESPLTRGDRIEADGVIGLTDADLVEADMVGGRR
ncbi:MAG: ABC transporter permease [Microthrixaceae bacterium]